MPGLLQPDRYFSKITTIDIKLDLLQRGLSCVFLDIDHTIRAHKTLSIPRDVGVWIGSARTAGVKFCLLSNNWGSNVFELAKSLEMPIIAKACKPLPFGFFAAKRQMGVARSDIVVIGDRLFTDVFGARLAGMKVYLVAPLVEVGIRQPSILHDIERSLLGQTSPGQRPRDEVEGVPAPANICRF